MRRVLPLISALVLVLLLWTGSTAHASEATEISSPAAAAAGHFQGDADEVPADSDKGMPHHHGACHGHCIATPAGDAGDTLGSVVTALFLAGENTSGRAREPDLQLRPPMA